MSELPEKELEEYYAQIERLQGGGNFLGMSLRDYFAAKAMQSVIAKSSLRTDEIIEAAAIASYGIADAMLAERAK